VSYRISVNVDGVKVRDVEPCCKKREELFSLLCEVWYGVLSFSLLLHLPIVATFVCSFLNQTGQVVLPPWVSTFFPCVYV